MNDSNSKPSIPSSDTYAIKTLKTLGELQKQGMLCDFTLRGSDGLELKVHKNVMYAASGFFRDLFSSDFKDSSENVLQLPISTGAVLEDVVFFMYQGYLKVKTAEDFIEVAKVAKYLQIEELFKICLVRTEELLHNTNALSCWRLAKQHLLKDIEEMCVSHILNSAQQLFQDPSFYEDLNDIEMKRLLEDKALKCDTETVFKMLVKWAENKTNSENEFQNVFSEFVDYAEFSSFDKEFLILNVLENEMLMKNGKVLRKFAECVKHKWEGNGDFMEKSKLARQSRKQLLVIKGSDVLGISTSEGKIEKFHKNCYLYDDFGYTTFGNNFLLMCGGRNSSSGEIVKDCKYFSPVTKAWIDLQPMNASRWKHNCVCVDGKIYACGGCECSLKAATSSIEVLDFNTEKWTAGPSMKKPRSCFGLTSMNGSLYAVGGVASGHTIEMFDTRCSKKWTLIYSNISYCDSVQCISMGYDIYCFNGFKNSFIFDIRMETKRDWSLSFLNDERVSLHVCKIDNGEFGVFLPTKSEVFTFDLNGKINSIYPLPKNTTQSNAINALVAMYY